MLLCSMLLMLSPVNAKKGDTSASPTNADETSAPSPEIQAEIPNDGDSKKFAKSLIALTIKNFRPISDALVYETLTFNPDNTWTTEASVEIMDEKMECVESGTWAMDPAESAKVASMTWTVNSTDCPAREAPQDIRLKVTIQGENIQVAFR